MLLFRRALKGLLLRKLLINRFPCQTLCAYIHIAVKDYWTANTCANSSSTSIRFLSLTAMSSAKAINSVGANAVGETHAEEIDRYPMESELADLVESESVQLQIDRPKSADVNILGSPKSSNCPIASGSDSKTPKEKEDNPGNRSKRSKRATRRGRLHKRQLEESSAGEGQEEGKGGNKRQRMGDGVDSLKAHHSETDYHFENGLRKVYPYQYTYLCHCKERWKGATILDMLNSEFMSGTPQFHKAQIENGLIKINGKTTHAGYVLKGKNELISNVTHRHELPVTSQPIKIVANTEDFLAVDKPSSIPVHPCGRYRHNSVIFMLSRDGFYNLRTLYRLDRLTSGLLIFGRNHETTYRVMENIKDRKVSKTYLCRVEGRFPDGVIDCAEPMDKVHQKIGTWRVKPGGKPSHTTFERVSYNGTSSVVKCSPHTGRTHQIRVHLQYLGYPIVNDPLYNDDVWGPEKGKNGHYNKTDEQLYKDLVTLHSSKFFESAPLQATAATAATASSDSDTSITDNSSHSLRYAPDPNCDWCKTRYKDPEPDSLIMFLHALSYKGPGWEFSTDEPDWAKEDWKPNT